MDNDPHAFITRHEKKELKPFLNFKHRTFNGDDCLYFIEAVRKIYQLHDSMEELFYVDNEQDLEQGLNKFYHNFFKYDHKRRTEKQLAAPFKKSSCKRINMFLRWMVRSNDEGLDFGLWKRLKPAQLFCPLDVHVRRASLDLGLLTREQSDWKAVSELTKNLRILCPEDPVKYDVALFGLGKYA